MNSPATSSLIDYSLGLNMLNIFKGILSLLILPLTLVHGQTFEDCSNDFNTQFKKISRQRTLKEIPDKTTDSLIQIIEANLNSCIIGKEIPDVELIGISGKRYTKEDLKGKVVLLNFWYTNCGPCVMEIPVLNKLYQAYKNEDFILLLILLDKEEGFQKFLQRNLIEEGVFYEIIPDSKSLLKSSFKFVISFPTNLFVDREGKVFTVVTGGATNSEGQKKLELKLQTIIDSELNKI